jgi:YesN/AraC family two-component response regulator
VPVHGATNGFGALRLFAEERFDIVLSDMRMPLLNGTRFLTLAREHAPETVRLRRRRRNSSCWASATGLT